MLPLISISAFTRKPNRALKSNNPFEILVSHNSPKGVILKPEVFEKLSREKIWREICEEWWEAYDEKTMKVLAKGKKMMKDGEYDKTKKFK